MKKKFYIWASIFAGIVVIAAILLIIAARHQNMQSGGNGFLSAPKIAKLQPNAFGKLNASTTEQGNGQGALAAAAGTPVSSTNAQNESVAAAAGTAGAGIAQRLIPYRPYEYVYAGGELPKIPKQMNVYERNLLANNNNTGEGMIGVLNNLGFGLADLTSFKNAGINSFTITQDQPYGYAITVSVPDQSVSVNINWQEWPHPSPILGANPLASNSRASIPNDDKILADANAFLKEHNINVNLYGSPEVLKNSWPPIMSPQGSASQENSASQGKSAGAPGMPYYRPQSAEVVYPLKIDGGEVYMQGGNKTGLTVSYDFASGKVSGVQGLDSQNYKGSLYGLETDAQKIIAQALGSNGTPNKNVQSLKIDLGTPFLTYEQMWNYTNYQNNEIFVPSLVFPVQNAPQGYYGPKFVLVALPEDIFKNSGINKVIEPMAPGFSPAAQGAASPNN